MNASAINPSSFSGTSRVSLMNQEKYSLTIFPSFCLHPMMEWESPLYLCNCMKLVKKGTLVGQSSKYSLARVF